MYILIGIAIFLIVYLFITYGFYSCKKNINIEIIQDKKHKDIYNIIIDGKCIESFDKELLDDMDYLKKLIKNIINNG